MTDSKVVIRINYDKDKIKSKQAPITAQQKHVVVWHTRRIVAALSILILIPIMIFWLIGDGREDPDEFNQNRTFKLAKPEENNPGYDDEAGVSPTKSEILKPTINKLESVNSGSRRPEAIIFDRKVIRASLNSALKDNEPFQQLNSPITLAENQTQELYYFSELRNTSEGSLYHCWFKEGKLVSKKTLQLKHGGGKLISERLMSPNDNGGWKIQLVDKKGKVYSEVNFVINLQ